MGNEAEKSDRSQKELTKEATKMLKMLQEKDDLLAEKDKILATMKSKEDDKKSKEIAKIEDLDQRLQEARKEHVILEKESRFQKEQVQQTKKEVDILKDE